MTDTTYLGREEAPFNPETWNMLDTAMIEAAKGQLSGRRLIHIEGPFGFGLKVIPLRDCQVADGITVSPFLPLNLVTCTFFLNKRDIAAAERDNLMFDLDPVVSAATSCAEKEDGIIFSGTGETPGLLGTKGSSSLTLMKWDKVGTAADQVITAVTRLDDAGFHGPYCLGLAPSLYNLLLRRYQQGDGTELDHVRTIVGGDVVKAPALKTGGVLLATGKRYCSIVLGQDMSMGFIGPVGAGYEFSISESLALLIRAPEAICVMR